MSAELLQTLISQADDDTWFGIFENHDLGHSRVGERCVFPFAKAQWNDAIVGSTRAPDGKIIGRGWRYILVHKTENPKDAFNWLINNENSTA